MTSDLGRPTAPAFEAWLAARQQSLTRFAYLLTGSQQAGQEAMQDALTRAYERWPSVSTTRDPESYVRRMIVNAHISGWRRTRRETPVPDPVRRSLTGPDLELADAVWRACAALPKQARAAVVLRYYEDLDYARIAELLDVSPAAARASVHRGLLALRDALGEINAEES
ncbi:MAG: SigE family RNA polymerase sigma factor [Nocardioides sp.]